MTKIDAVQVNQIYLIFNRPHFQWTLMSKTNKINTTFAGILLHNTKHTTSDVEKMKTKKVAVQ